MRESIKQDIKDMKPEDFTEEMSKLTQEDIEMLSPAERLMILGIDPFSFYRKKKVMDIDKDEYNDDFYDEPGSVDEELEYDDDDEIIRYIHENDEADEYDLAQLTDFPFLRAVLLYNHNKRKYYA